MRRLRFAALAASLIFVAACSSQARAPAGQATPGYRTLPPREVQALLAREKPFLLNVHVPDEGYLAGTNARIPYTEVVARVAELPPDRDAPLVVYCMTGRMSRIAAEELVRLGYRQVIDLDGGMVAWQAAGYAVLPEQPASR